MSWLEAAILWAIVSLLLCLVVGMFAYNLHVNRMTMDAYHECLAQQDEQFKAQFAAGDHTDGQLHCRL